MRCLTLADELCRRGAAVSFLCRELPGNLISFIESRGYLVTRLTPPCAEFQKRSDDVPHAEWLSVAWEKDATDTDKVLREILPDWLIIDHYSIDQRWEQRLNTLAKKVLVIDDLADRPHCCDLLLDQNLYPDMDTRYDDLLSTGCQKLLGPYFALLRPEFRQIHTVVPFRSGDVKRILVFWGGIDPTNETEKTIRALATITDRCFAIDVVVGKGNPSQGRIEALCAAQKGFTYYCQTNEMAGLMNAADLAIGAGGSATWERCCLALPALVMSVADNQVAISSSADAAGVVSYLGDSAEISVGDLARFISETIAAPGSLRTMSEMGWRLVDGNGSIRVAEKMEMP